MTTPKAVNPMVAVKLCTTVIPNLDEIEKGLKEGIVPLIVINSAGESREVKFSDIYGYKSFLRANALGDIEVRVSGGSRSPLVQRIVNHYIPNDLTPNCSLGQLLAVEGVKIVVKHHLTEHGKTVKREYEDRRRAETEPASARSKADSKSKTKGDKAADKAAEKADKPEATATGRGRRKAAEATAKPRRKADKPEAKTGRGRRSAIAKAVEIEGAATADAGAAETSATATVAGDMAPKGSQANWT